MIVFVILGSLGKKRKPQTPSGITEEEDVESGIRDIPADIFEENLRKYFVTSDPEVVNTNENQNKSAEFSENTLLDTPASPWDNYQGILDSRGFEEGTSMTYKIEDHIEEITRQSKLNQNLYTARKTDFVKKALKDFDPKKAIIYKEVFEPKYF
jgi:hypothetical protein